MREEKQKFRPMLLPPRWVWMSDCQFHLLSYLPPLLLFQSESHICLLQRSLWLCGPEALKPGSPSPTTVDELLLVRWWTVKTLPAPVSWPRSSVVNRLMRDVNKVTAARWKDKSTERGASRPVCQKSDVFKRSLRPAASALYTLPAVRWTDWKQSGGWSDESTGWRRFNSAWGWRTWWRTWRKIWWIERWINRGMGKKKGEIMTVEEAVERWSDRWMERLEVKERRDEWTAPRSCWSRLLVMI